MTNIRYSKNKINFNPKTMDLELQLANDNTVINLNEKYTCSSQDLFYVNRYRIEVSLLCDLLCDYCIVFMNNITKPIKLLKLETAKNIVEQFNNTIGSKGDIVLMGGEPLLNWEVVQYIIENCDGKTLLFTNALKLDRDKQMFLRSKHTRILTSLDGFNDKHNKYRFHSKTIQEFNLISNNIKDAIQEGCDVGIACLVHDANIHELIPIVDFFVNSLQAKSFSFAYSHYLLDYSKIVAYPFDDYIKAICELFDYSKKNAVYIDQSGRLLRGILKKERTIAGCKAGTSQKTFYPDGYETICTKLDLLNKNGIAELLTLLPVTNNKCSNCIACNLCGGGCYWDDIIMPNNAGVDERLCASKVSLISYILKDIEKEMAGIKSKDEALKKIEGVYEPIMF